MRFKKQYIYLSFIGRRYECDGRVMTNEEWQKVVESGNSVLWDSVFTDRYFPDMRGRVAGHPNVVNTQGASVGAESIMLTESEIPQHYHKVNPPSTNTIETSSNKGEHSHVFQESYLSNVAIDYDGYNNTWSGSVSVPTSGASGKLLANIDSGSERDSLKFTNSTRNITATKGEHKHTVDIKEFTSGNKGGGQAHNNMQPTLFAGKWYIYIG